MRRTVGALVMVSALLIAACGDDELADVAGTYESQRLPPPEATPTTPPPANTEPPPAPSAIPPAPTTSVANAVQETTCNLDPNRRYRLGGVEGVTCEQQRWAEDLVTRVADHLPQWADYRVAEAAGFQTTNDAFTGYEHFVNWGWIGDGNEYDPNYPESLVYVPGADGSKTLVAAMFMLPRTGPIENQYKPGGNLMQFHEHNNLCYQYGPNGELVLVGEDDQNGNCPEGSFKPPDPAPMVHVWITQSPGGCGPFASIPGEAGGQEPPGEERLCLPQFADVP